MDLALIDDDRLYHQIFVDYFEKLGVTPTIFNCGERFLSLTTQEALKYPLIVIDHTLHDMKGVDCIKYLKPALNPVICVISTYGEAVPKEFRKIYNVTGDYTKIDLQKISAWYFYFKQEKLALNQRTYKQGVLTLQKS